MPIRTDLREAWIVGIVNPVGTFPTIIYPVFSDRPGGNTYFLQILDAGGRIEGFREANLEDLTRLPSEEWAKHESGMEGVWGVAFDQRERHILPGSQLLRLTKERLEASSLGAFFALSVLRLLGEDSDIENGYRSAYRQLASEGRSAATWRDVVALPAIAKHVIATELASVGQMPSPRELQGVGIRPGRTGHPEVVLPATLYEQLRSARAALRRAVDRTAALSNALNIGVVEFGSEDAPPHAEARSSDDARKERMRRRAALALQLKLGVQLKRTGRSTWESADRATRIVVATSKNYHASNQDYWYAYHASRKSYLDNAKSGYFVICGTDLNFATAIPAREMHKLSKSMSESHRSGKIYWHVKSKIQERSHLLILRGEEVPLNKYIVPLPGAVVLIVGAPGSGKTTLLSAAAEAFLNDSWVQFVPELTPTPALGRPRRGVPKFPREIEPALKQGKTVITTARPESVSAVQARYHAVWTISLGQKTQGFDQGSSVPASILPLTADIAISRQSSAQAPLGLDRVSEIVEAIESVAAGMRGQRELSAT